jgi:hypothetical protein
MNGNISFFSSIVTIVAIGFIFSVFFGMVGRKDWVV